MANIKLPFFRGLVPRRDEQHMQQGQAVKAVNTDLDSGELRPLITPHREKVFPRAGEPGFLSPKPVDPSDPGPVDPADPGIPGVPVPPGCIPVTIVTPPADASFSYLPDDITFTVALNADATVPVTIRWYIDDVLIAGETGTTLTITPDALQIEYNNGELVLSPNIPVITRLYGVIKVVVQNPCGIAEAFCTVTIEDVYRCDAFKLVALASAEYYWPGDNDTQGDGFLAGTVNIPVNVGDTSALRTGAWLTGGCEGQKHQEGFIVVRSGSAANPGVFFGPNFNFFCIARTTGEAYFNYNGRYRRMDPFEPERGFWVGCSLHIGTSSIFLNILNGNVEDTLSVPFTPDGLPHLIGFRVSGLPDSFTVTGSFLPAGVLAATYELYVDGFMVASTVFDHGNDPANNGPYQYGDDSQPEEIARSILFNGGRWSDRVINGNIALLNAGWKNNQQGGG